jgi:hypothetical protein
MIYQLNLCREPLTSPREFEIEYTVDSPMSILRKWEEYSPAFRAGKVFTVTVLEADYDRKEYDVIETVDIYEFASQHAERYAKFVKDSTEADAIIDDLFAPLLAK